ncbi:MAG: YfiR family protein [Bacteroidia bacterium]|nr:YfiR family protein [Bacteroidia bacterium]
MKSAYLYKICNAVSWSNPNSQFVITIYGENSNGGTITIPKDKLINKQPILIQQTAKISEIGSSNALFICDSEIGRLESILKSIQGKPIMTFGDTEGFGKRGVMINFVVRKNRVTYSINRTSLGKSGFILPNQIVETAAYINY